MHGQYNIKNVIFLFYGLVFFKGMDCIMWGVNWNIILYLFVKKKKSRPLSWSRCIQEFMFWYGRLVSQSDWSDTWPRNVCGHYDISEQRN